MAESAIEGCDVLVVDDDEDMREMLAAYLEVEGYRVGVASSAAAALASLDTMRTLPRLVLLDLMMPGMSADEFLGALRARPERSSIAVVLVSGAHDLVLRAQALRPAAYLAKPVDMSEVVGMVERYVV
jgi:DNA-binding response OmpR family regulator